MMGEMSMKTLVGYTGFVGSNLYETGEFDEVYNSKNIEYAYGTNPDLLVYAGLRAEKYLANRNPQKDMEAIIQAEKNILEINAKKLVLISTIDVFKSPKMVNEKSLIEVNGLHPYGYNRYQLELWVRKNYPDALIIRLPGLYGKNIKKNFIYDYINVIPFMLDKIKMTELLKISPEIKDYYILQDTGFYKIKELTDDEKDLLKKKIRHTRFNALYFTDSRSKYQFYSLERLWKDIQIALNAGIQLWHPATEPITSRELYRYLAGEEFINELKGEPADYDYKTIYAELFGGKDGYICNKNLVLKEISDFVRKYV